MSVLADLCASPLLYNYKELTYELSPLSQKDWGDLCRFAQYQPYYSLKQALALDPVMTAENRGVLTEVLKECAANPVLFGSDVFGTIFAGPDGMCEAVYLSIKKRHPDVARDKIKEWDKDEVSQMMELIVAISTVSNEGNSEEIKKNQTEHLKSLLPKLREMKKIR